jgi:hypothetical protein
MPWGCPALSWLGYGAGVLAGRLMPKLLRWWMTGEPPGSPDPQKGALGGEAPPVGTYCSAGLTAKVG